MMSESQTVAPGCPFCGEPESYVDEISVGRFSCICQDCGCIGPSSGSAESAVDLWNHRVNRMDWPVTWLPMPAEDCGHIVVSK